MLPWVLRWTDVGKTAASKNAWSARSWVPSTVELEALSGTELRFRVGVEVRGEREPTFLQADLPLPRPATTVDELRDVLIDLGSDDLDASGAKPRRMKGDAMADGTSAILLQLPGATDDWSLPDDLWLNSTPYPRSVRQMFYEDVVSAMLSAVADDTCPRRMKCWVTPPELNMEMDSYRVGTLLELVRECAMGFATLGFKTRICVQGSMGEGVFMGVPRVLSGVTKVLQMMDWQNEKGEEHEGIVDFERPSEEGEEGEGEGEGERAAGNAAEEGLICFGAVGADEVGSDDDVLLLLAPQNMVGASIYEPLSSMVEAAEAKGAAIILINPLLQDRQSSSGLMGVRGRADRMAFAESFEPIYTFRNIYSGTTFMYPILGAVRTTRGPNGHAVLYQRRESGSRTSEGGGNERYEPVGCWRRREPTTEELTRLVPNKVAAVEEVAGGGVKVEVIEKPVDPSVERMPWD